MSARVTRSDSSRYLTRLVKVWYTSRMIETTREQDRAIESLSLEIDGTSIEVAKRYANGTVLLRFEYDWTGERETMLQDDGIFLWWPGNLDAWFRYHNTAVRMTAALDESYAEPVRAGHQRRAQMARSF